MQIDPKQYMFEWAVMAAIVLLIVLMLISAATTSGCAQQVFVGGRLVHPADATCQEKYNAEAAEADRRRYDPDAGFIVGRF
jgi:hypothetical protein